MVRSLGLVLVFFVLARGIYLQVDISSENPVINIVEHVSIGVYNDDNSISSDPATISISGSSKKLYPATSEFYYTGETIITQLTFLSKGSTTVTFSTPLSSNTITYSVQPLNLIFTKDFSVSKAKSTSAFQIGLEVQNPNTNETELNNDYNISLSLECLTSCSGKVFQILDNEENFQGDSYLTILTEGVLSIDKFYIKSSGTFKLIASSKSTTSALSSSIYIQNKVDSIEVVFDSSSVSAYKDFNVTVQLLGDDGNLYFHPTEVTLNTSLSSYNGDLSEVTESGIWEFTCFFNHSGSKFFEVSTNDSSATGYNDSLEILPNVLKFSDFSKNLPTNDRHTFEFKVKIYDSEGLKVVTEKDPIEVVAFVDDDHSLGGKTRLNSNKGVAKFEDINFDDTGKQKLRVTIGDEDFAYYSEFDIEATDCRVGSGPIACTSVLIFLLVFLTFIFYNTDKQVQSYPKVRLLLLVYPPTALIFKSPPIRRITVVLLIISCELLMLTFIGAVYAHFDDTTQHYDKDFRDYYGRILYKGGMGWAIAQIGTIPLFYLNFWSIYNNKVLKYFLLTSALVIVLSFGAMVGMTIKYCIGFSQYWTANFLIFLLFDFLIMQPIYTMILLYLKGKRAKNKMGDKTDLKGDEVEVSIYSIVSQNTNKKN